MATPSDNITDLAQDPQGFIWMAGEGLHRYDGYQYKNYYHDPDDSTSLSSNDISNLVVDREGILWVAAEGRDGGLHRFHPETGSFTRYQHDSSDPESPSNNEIFFLYEGRDGTLWLGTFQGELIRFDRSTETFATFKVPDYEGTIEHILEDRSGVLWVATMNGLYTFDRDRETFTRINFAESESSKPVPGPVFALYEDREGILWIGTTLKTLLRYDPKTGQVNRYDDFDEGIAGVDIQELQQPFVEDIVEDRQGNLWFGTWGDGLKRFDRESQTISSYSNDSRSGGELISLNAFRLFEDRQGTMWVCLVDFQLQDRRSGGLFKFNILSDPFTSYRYNAEDPTSLSENKGIVDFHTDQDGKLWIATQTGVLNVFDPKTDAFDHFSLAPVDPGNQREYRISNFLRDRKGQWWIGGYSPGLQRYDPESNVFTHTGFHLDKVNETIASGNVGPFVSGVLALLEDRDGMIWIGTLASGLIRFDPDTGDVTQYKPDSDRPGGLQGDIVYALHEDRQGNLWIGSMPRSVDLRTGSLQRFDRRTNTFEQFSEFGASSVFEDSAGRLWVRSLTMGLFKWDLASGSYTRYSQENGLPINQVGCVVEDDDTNLWIASPAGIWRFDPDTEAVHKISFSVLPEDFALSKRPSNCVRDENGRLYFGGISSILAFHPDDFYFNTSRPEVALLDLQIRGESASFGTSGSPLSRPFEQTDAFTLTHRQQDFAIQYVGLHYEDPSRNAYRYRLEPYNDDWIEAGTERWARFFQVPPGKYTFHVQAASSNGVWNEEGATVAITILPPWWRTTWAYGLYGLFLLGAILAANRFQSRRLIRRERESARIQMAQLETRAAMERAEMAERLEEVKTSFFVNISHEFRTPLTLILGSLKDTLDEVYGKIENRLLLQPLGTMQRNAERLHLLINQLLDFEKLEAGGLKLQAREADIVAFLRALTLSFTSRAEREQKSLRFETQQEALDVYFDPEKLEKVVYNLLSNAFKFTHAGDSIRVSVYVHEGTARFEVRDTGEGIASRELDQIFARFYQVDGTSTRQYEGTGIGLALARELVELHHGSIEVESREGEGSTFFVTLPLGRIHLRDEELAAEEMEVAHEPERSDAREMHRFAGESDNAPVENNDEPATILIVEDNRDLREYLRTHLNGYSIVEAENGEEGLEKAVALMPDLVISDVMMPVMDGMVLCESLRKNVKTQDIPVILLTAKATEGHKIEGLRAGADDYLYKPFSADELLARTENLIDLRRRLQSQYRSEVVLKPADVVVTSEDAVFVEKVRAIVEDQLADSWFGVERLAEEVNLSRRQLQRRMNTVMQTTASTFIRDMRLERAMQLLKKRAGTVSEICYAVGYNDPRHFSMLFKQKYGYSPSDGKASG